MAGHYRDKGPLDCKIYVGNLGSRAAKQELEKEFGRYGDLRSVWVARNPPGFAFVEFLNPHDASDAVKDLDGRMICGRRVSVEKSSGKSRHGRYGGGGGGGGRGRFPSEGDKGYGGYPGAGGGRYRDRSPRRRYSRSKSRSRSRSRRRKSRSRSHSSDRRRRSKSHSPSKSRSRSRSHHSKSRSRSRSSRPESIKRESPPPSERSPEQNGSPKIDQKDKSRSNTPVKEETQD